MTNDNLRSLESSRKMSGVLTLINGTDPTTNSSIIQRPDSLSPDEKCPNCQFGLYRNDERKYQWNPNGLGILQERYDFPIFALYPYDKSTTRTFNRVINGAAYNARRSFENFPLKAVELSSLMNAAMDAPTCLRRKFCSPVGGHSVYSTPSIDMNENDGKPIIVVSAAMDSKSFFHDITLGLNNGISGSIALLAIAEALSRSPKLVKDFQKHILFTLFTGESWGFSGSQRFVKNIYEPFSCIQNSTDPTPCTFNTGISGGCTFPCFKDLDFRRINFRNIDSIFELSSLSNGGRTGDVQELRYFVHVDDENNVGNKLLVQGLEKLSAVGKAGAGFVRSASEDGEIRKLPPSSSMAFLEKNSNIPAVVISDFQAKLSNYYNSEYDDGSDLDVSTITTAICSIANVTSQAIWLHAQELLDSNTDVPIFVNCSLVGELLDCLTVNDSCPLFNTFSNDSNGRIPHDTGTFSYTSQSLLSFFHYNILGSLNAASRSDRKCSIDEDCELGEICVQLICVKSFTRYHDSYGIGLEFNEQGYPVVVDPEKATWVESTWQHFNLRLFEINSGGSQISEFVFGILITIFSVIGVLFCKNYLRKTLKID